jgi:kynurenine formamidase
MPVYPGTEPPEFIAACTKVKDGFVEKKISLYSHTGTHMDAPAHILPGAKTLDEFPVSHFFGQAAVLGVTTERTITKTSLEQFVPLIRKSEFVLLYTEWSKFWGTDTYFSDFPVLTAEAAHWLSNFDLKGIGVDTISVDKVGTTDYTNHKIFLEKEIIIIENLTNLRNLSGTLADLYCFPLLFSEADGSPVRAVAVHK